MTKASPSPQSQASFTHGNQGLDRLSGTFAKLSTEQASDAGQSDEGEDYILDHYYVAEQDTASSLGEAGEGDRARSRSASSSHGSALSDQAPPASSPGTSTASDDESIPGKMGAQVAGYTTTLPAQPPQRQVFPSPLLLGKQLPPRTSSRQASAVVSAMKQDSPLPSAYYTAPLNPPFPFSEQVTPPRVAHKPPLLHNVTAPPELPFSDAYAGSDCSTTPSTATSAFFGLYRGESSGGPAKRRSDVGASAGSFEAWRQRQRYSMGSNDTAKDLFTDSQPPSAVVRNFAPLSPVHLSGPSAFPLSMGAARPSMSHRKTHSGALTGEGVRKRTSGTPAKRTSGMGAGNSSSTPTAGTNTPQLTEEDLRSFEEFGARVVQRPSLTNIRSAGNTTPTPLGSPQAGSSGVVPPLKRHVSTGSATSRNSIGPLSPELPLSNPLSRHSSTGSRTKKRPKVQPAASSGPGQFAQVVSPTLTRNLSTSMRMTCLEDGVPRDARGIEPEELADMLAKSQVGKGKQRDRDETVPWDARKLLVIDGRSLANYLSSAGRIAGSINVNFPSLLVKRFRKGNTGSFQLEAFITTEQGKRYFRSTFGSSGGSLDNVDIVIVDEHLDEREVASSTSTSTGVILLSVMQRLFSQQERKGGLVYLRGRFGLLAEHPALGAWMRQGESETSGEAPAVRASDRRRSLQTQRGPEDGPKQGLLRLQPSGPTRALPRIEIPNPGTRTPILPPRKDSLASTPASSPQSGSSNGKPKPPRLRRLDTSETLLGANARSTPPRRNDKAASSAGLTPPSLAMSDRGKSLQELCTAQSRTPTLNAFGADVHAFGAFPSAFAAGAATPAPTTHPETVFSCSTIIPGFLFLGSEPCKPSDYEELETLGVKRILNMALECTDEEEECVRRFQKYHFVPLRDFVEEVGVQARIDEANKLLDDASLHSAPVYVHCKAGKSRSVTIVLAYLIHRYRWSLKRAYAHVADRRKGMCPNIGFLSELMKFEERELGSKSNGVATTGLTPATAGPAAMTESGSYFQSGGGGGSAGGASSAAPRLHHTRRHQGNNHARESMPANYRPLEASPHGFSSDHAIEVRRPCDGTWRPARQDPSSDRFLVTRRQSKAGLESAVDGSVG